MNVYKPYFLIASLTMALAVALGAFGAHGLKPFLNDYGTEVYKTANFYHFTHGLALFIVILTSRLFEIKLPTWIFYGFISGILLFSGSLYLLALHSYFTAIPTWLGAITPIGGLFFIGSWIGLGYFFSKKLN